MKIMHSALLAFSIGAASISNVQAQDSFSLGINVGGYGYAPPVVYYPAPVYYSEPVVYYREPVYYQPAPRYYGYASTVVSFGYNNFGGHRDWNRGGWDRGHRGWDRGGRDRGHRGWDRGRDRGDWGRRGRGRDD
jgi:hypothetical protein